MDDPLWGAGDFEISESAGQWWRMKWWSDMQPHTLWFNRMQRLTWTRFYPPEHYWKNRPMIYPLV